LIAATKITFGETQVVNCIENIGLPCSVVAVEAMHFATEFKKNVFVVFELTELQ
jgi:hypothetical protein